jgi:hypothetical protein
MSTITKEIVISRRLGNQQISEGGFMRPESLVAWMGCIQAQDFAGAKWAVGSRLQQGTEGNNPDGSSPGGGNPGGGRTDDGKPEPASVGGTRAKPGDDKTHAGKSESADSGGTGAKPDGAGRHWTDAAVQQAFNEGRILRTHILRPTWHFVAPADIHWMLALTAPRIAAFCAGMHRQLELDQPTFKKSQATLQKALAGGRQLTRKELLPIFRQAKIRTDELRLAHLLMQAELDGVICSGAMSGKQFTYALMEERAPEGKRLHPEEAVGELALRYFKSRGPATLADFAWWAGLTVTDAKKGVEAHRSQFIQEEVEEQRYWIHSASPLPAGRLSQSSPAASSPPATGIRVLPAFDEYTVAYKDRDLVLSPKHALRCGNGIFKPILLNEGRIAGTWQRTIHKDHIVITTDLFRPLGRRAVKAAFARYEAFMQAPLVYHFD